MLSTEDTYPIDRFMAHLLPVGRTAENTRAMDTGIRRPPLKGEWFINGTGQALRAQFDMSVDFPIAALVAATVAWTLIEN